MGSCLSRERATSEEFLDKSRSSLSRDDAEERRSRATNEDVIDIIQDIFQEFNKGYKHEEKDVNMGRSRKCSYNKHDGDKDQLIVKETITIWEPIPRQKSPKGSTKVTHMPIELWGITLRQLRAIIANVERRCEKEGWKDWEGNLLTPETVTLHDINTYITKPYTKESESSFVETLPSTGGTQPPRFFGSHTWGESFFLTVDCI